MKRLFTILPLLLLAAGFTHAQSTVSGTVTDATGAPLIGTSILVEGTISGTVTDVDGKYTLEVPAGSNVLVFSYTGFRTANVEINGRTTVDLTMESDAVYTELVVVTAQGIRRDKKALGYSVSTVNEKAIQDRPQADVGRVLQGKIPGVNITSTSGVSGTGTNITIRGYSSITGSNQPLFVVDGVPFNSSTNSRGGFTSGGQSASSRFLDLDPNSIESISVLKGLAATVTYGDQGRNGVILVTTKNGSGKTRKAEFNLTQSYFTNTAHLPRYQNDYVGGFQQNLGYFFSNWGPTLEEARIYPSQNTNTALTTHPYAFLSNLAARAAMADYVTSVSPYEMVVFPNNVSDFFRTGVIANTSLNISGGNESSSYNLSAGYLDEQGYIPENGLKKLNLGLGVTSKLSSKLSVVSSFSFANTDQESPPLSGGTGNNALDFPSVLANVMFTPRQVDLMGWPYENPVDGSSVYFRSPNDIVNPRWVLKHYKTTGEVNRFFGTTSFNFQFTEDLSLIYRAGLDTYTENQEFQLGKGGVQAPTGAYFTRDLNNTIWDNSLILSYNLPLLSKLTAAAKLGGNIRNDVFRVNSVASSVQLARGLFRHDNFINNTGSDFTSEETRMGIFGELTLDYDNFLYLNFAGRNDWTSTVEPENRRIFYPSASLSFVPTSAFTGLQNEFITFLKVRAGVGTSAGFPRPYQTRNVLDQDARAWLNASGAALQTHAVSNVLGNPNLKPELHSELEVGLEGKFFNNRVGIDVTAYRRNTRDLITSSPLDASTGYTSTTINIGEIRNEGIELTFTATPVAGTNFSWDATLVYSRNVPTVVDLGGTLQEVQVTGFGGALGNYAIVGKPFNIIKGTGFRRNAQGQLEISSQGFPQATASPVVLGDPNPAFNTSFINALNYKNFSLEFMISYRHGGALYSSTAGALMGRGLTYDTGLENGYDRAQTFLFPGVLADGSPNNVQVTASDVGFNNIYFFGDEGRIYDGSTIRLQEISLSYSLPQNLLSRTPFKAITLQITGNNLWYRALHMPEGLNFDTDNLGLGVGNGLGFDFLTGPSARRIGGTLKVTF